METNKFNYITIQQYLEGKLDEKTMHELEKRALDDPFLADALEGYAQTETPASKHLSILQTQLQERIAQSQENKNLFHISWQRLSVAAAACLLFVTATMLFWIRENQAEKQLASQPKQVDVNLSPLDSLKQAPLGQQDGIILEENVSAQANTVKAQSGSATSTREMNTIARVKAENKDVLQLSALALNDSASEATSAETTSASYTINAKDLEELAPQQIDQALQGRVAGISADSGKRKRMAKSARASAVSRNEPILSESIVVRGLTTASQPSIGWDLYYNYLQENIRKTAAEGDTGSVVLSFTVSKDGQPLNIKIKQGLKDVNNLEAIRLLKEGPLWQRRQDSTATITVHFKK